MVDMGEDARTCQIQGDDKTGKESHRTHKAEEVHRAVAELRDEIDGQQIQIATHETAHAELTCAILALLMVYDLLPYVAETIHLGDDRDVTVHLVLP